MLQLPTRCELGLSIIGDRPMPPAEAFWPIGVKRRCVERGPVVARAEVGAREVREQDHDAHADERAHHRRERVHRLKVGVHLRPGRSAAEQRVVRRGGAEGAADGGGAVDLARRRQPREDEREHVVGQLGELRCLSCQQVALRSHLRAS